MNISLLYGKGELALDLPDDTFVVEPTTQHALENPVAGVREAKLMALNSIWQIAWIFFIIPRSERSRLGKV